MNELKNPVLILALFFILLFPLSPARGGYGFESEECLSCHGEEDFTGVREGKEVDLHVDINVIEKSVHGKSRCTSCHVDATGTPHKKVLSKVDCGTCHENEEKTYGSSIHGISVSKGEKDVPGCTTCHGAHDILPVENPKSRAFSLNIVDVCLNCHEDEKIEAEHKLPGTEYFKAYRESVHGKAIVRAGLNVAAVCPDCHGNHKILPADDPESQVNKIQIPSDCGKCHPGIQEEYDKSIHGKGLRAGIKDSPVCTDCHGEHTIAKITDPSAKVFSMNIPKTCGVCHDSEIISTRYALPKKRFATYMDSFHGIALEFGMTKTANCASCHGYHLVLPPSDPASSINVANIPETCGKCHPKTSVNFAKGKIHFEVSKEGHMGVWIVRIFYTLFIGALAVLFVLHISFDIIARGRHKRERMRKENGKGGE